MATIAKIQFQTFIDDSFTIKYEILPLCTVPLFGALSFCSVCNFQMFYLRKIVRKKKRPKIRQSTATKLLRNDKNLFLFVFFFLVCVWLNSNQLAYSSFPDCECDEQKIVKEVFFSFWSGRKTRLMFSAPPYTTCTT